MSEERRSAESYAQEALDKRGYVVIATLGHKAIGETTLIQSFDDQARSSEAIAVVISETDREDMAAQTKLLGLYMPVVPFSGFRYYRCKAE